MPVNYILKYKKQLKHFIGFMSPFLSYCYQKVDLLSAEWKLPHDVCPSFGTVIVPSHGGSALQFVASDTAVLIVFPVHNVQELPFLKYPASQAKIREDQFWTQLKMCLVNDK